MTDLSKVPDDVLLKLVEQRQSRALSSMSDDELLAALESRKPQRPGVMATIDAGVRGAADMLTFGMADEIAAKLGSWTGGGTYDENLKKERAIDAADEREHPIARTVGQVAGGVAGGVGAANRGLSLTNAAISRGAPRLAQVGVAGVEGLAGGGTYGFGSGEGGFDQRVANMPWNAAAGFVGGAAGQAAAPLVQRGIDAAGGVVSRLMGRPGPTVVNAEELARNLGVEFRRDAENGTRGLVDRATGIPLTRGQATRDFSQIAQEEAMRNDAMGRGAGRTMRQFDERQNEAVTRAAERMVGQPNRALDDAGATDRAVRDAFDAAQNRTRDAYDFARGQDATTDASMFNQIGTVIRNELQTNAESPIILSPRLHPATSQALRRLDGLIPQDTGGTVVGVTAQRLETARRELRSFYNAAENNPADREAMRRVIQRFDQIWDTMADNGLFQGSEEAINALRVARQSRREQGRLFEPQDRFDDAGRLVEKILNRQSTETEVANYLYGVSKVGEKGDSARLVDRLGEILGRDTEQFNRIRLGAIDRLLYTPAGDMYGRQRVVTRINDYLDGAGRDYATRLHTPEQMTALREFRDAIERTIPPRGTTNPSGTAWAMSRLVQSAGQRLMQVLGVSAGGPVGLAAVVAAEAVPSMRGSLAARRATQGGLPIPRLQASPLLQQSAVGAGIAGGVATKGLVTEDEKEPLRINVR